MVSRFEDLMQMQTYLKSLVALQDESLVNVDRILSGMVKWNVLGSWLGGFGLSKKYCRESQLLIFYQVTLTLNMLYEHQKDREH